MSKFKETLMKDIGWKLLSLGLAILLWFVVINIENPVESRNFSAVLQLRNESAISDRGQTITNFDEVANSRVVLKIRGQRLALDRLYQNRNDIQAYVDLSLIDETPGLGETVTGAVTVRLPSNLGDNYQIESRSPASVELVVENVVTAKRDIQLYLEGNTDGEGYSIAMPEIMPPEVEISGIQSAVQSVETVRAIVNIENISEDTTITAALTPYNNEGQVVGGVTLNPPEAEIYIPVKMSKKVSFKAETFGTPLSGYNVESIEFDPPSIYVIGDEEALASIENIELPSINVEGRNSSFSHNYAVKYLLKNGVSLRNSQQNLNVTVNVNIAEDVEREITLNSDNISFFADLADGLVAEVALDNVSFTVKGPAKVLETLNEAEIRGSARAVNLEAGYYRLPLSVELPEGVVILNEAEAMLSVNIVSASDEGETPDDENAEDTENGNAEHEQNSGTDELEAENSENGNPNAEE